MPDLFDLTGKVAVITGAAGLLGPKHAEALLEKGAAIWLTDREPVRLISKANELRERYPNSSIQVEFMDVTDPDSVAAFFSDKECVDILINNAANDPKIQKDKSLGVETRFETMTFDYWKEGIDAIVNGTFLCSQAAANLMLRNGGGVIANIASDLSVIAPDQRLYSMPEQPREQRQVKPITYSAAKHAVVGMTKYLAVYFAKDNIRVNCLSPTGIFNNHPDDFREKLENIIPMGRMANIDEYKGAIQFMCSNASSYMTGANLVIDGGKTVW